MTTTPPQVLVESGGVLCGEQGACGVFLIKLLKHGFSQKISQLVHFYRLPPFPTAATDGVS